MHTSCFSLLRWLQASRWQSCLLDAAGNETVGKTIESIIINGESNIGSLDDDDRLIQVFTYYSDRSFKPIWVRDNGMKTKGRMLLEFLGNIENHGLREFKYRLADIRALVGDPHPRALAELEMLLTSAFIDLARDLTRGRVSPKDVTRDNDIKVRELGAAYLLDGAEKAENLLPYIQTLMPEDKRYHRLVAKLQDYRAHRGCRRLDIHTCRKSHETRQARCTLCRSCGSFSRQRVTWIRRPGLSTMPMMR